MVSLVRKTAKHWFDNIIRSCCTRQFRVLFGVFWFLLFVSNCRLMLDGQQSMVQVPVTVATREPSRPLPTPILVMGMPKTGTSTIHAFFERAGYRSSHYKCQGMYCGLCIQAAIKKKEPPLKACGDYEVYAQMDIENLGQCHLPQVVDLDILYQEAPNATWILPTRNMTRWARSTQNWIGASMRSLAKRLAKCKEGPETPFPKDLIAWHQAHLERIRNYCSAHPSLTLVEIDIEDPTTGTVMAQHFRSDASYWGHENDSSKSKASWASVEKQKAG
jgi:hypothetical protein